MLSRASGKIRKFDENVESFIVSLNKLKAIVPTISCEMSENFKEEF